MFCIVLSLLAAAQNDNPAQQAERRTVQLNPLPLNHVRLTGGPLKVAQDADAKYLLELEPDRMALMWGPLVLAGVLGQEVRRDDDEENMPAPSAFATREFCGRGNRHVESEFRRDHLRQQRQSGDLQRDDPVSTRQGGTSRFFLGLVHAVSCQGLS